MKTRKKGILFFAVVAGIMLSSGITIAINPAQWFEPSTTNMDELTDEEFDALGLDIGYSDDQVLQFCSANEYVQTNRKKVTTKNFTKYFIRMRFLI